MHKCQYKELSESKIRNIEKLVNETNLHLEKQITDSEARVEAHINRMHQRLDCNDKKLSRLLIGGLIASVSLLASTITIIVKMGTT